MALTIKVDIKLPPLPLPCFAAGTRIRTPDGEREVETLKRGDLILTASGKAAPIRWMGVATVSRRFADPVKTLPIVISAGALAVDLPVRALSLSPSHALSLDGVLIEAGALVNESTISRDTDVPETFRYYHVELSDHALIYAEGVLTETFIDNVSRMAFDNWEEHEALGEDAPIAEMDLPRAKSKRQVPADILHSIAERAALLTRTASVTAAA